MAARADPNREVKVNRLELRASPRQTTLIKQAAEVSGKTVSSFVLDAAYLEAQRALADRSVFRLDANRWQRFVKALDRPVKDKPRLRRLMETPGA
jgi:uncharacterized protein (DUF1778 family)